MKYCVFTGGGTGGHIYPGLAIIDELNELFKKNGLTDEFKIVWIGSNNGSDKRLVDKSGSADKFYGIPSGKLRRYFSFNNFLDFFKIFAGAVSAIFLLARLKPIFVFSKGGFVSVPPCLAAKLLKIPVYTHECDYSPGLATRLNVKSATKVFVSYEQTKTFFSEAIQKKVVVTGNPVRPVFYTADSERGKKFLNIKNDLSKPILLVLGGSLGSKQINELVWNNIDWLCENFIVVHQTGKIDEHLESLKPKSKDAIYLSYQFIYEQIPDVIAAADVVLSRAGANFLCECAVAGKPMVLVPLSTAGSRGDQLENARFYEKNNAALVLSGDDADSEHLKDTLQKLLNSADRSNFTRNVRKICGEKKPALIIANLLFEKINNSKEN